MNQNRSIVILGNVAQGTKYVGVFSVAIAVLCVFAAPWTDLPQTVKAQGAPAITVILAIVVLMSPALLHAPSWHLVPVEAPSDLLVRKRTLRI